VTSIAALGWKDRSLPGNGLDARDPGPRRRHPPGQRQPRDSGDAIERRVAADLGPLAGGFFNVSNSVANEVSGTVTPYRVD
jgi:hypothetical protein